MEKESRTYLTVEEFNKYVNNIFSAEELLHNVPVVGEVSGYKAVGGHGYFTLKDKNAQLQITCFNCDRTYQPVDGEAVKVIGSPNYYVKTGKFSLSAYRIEPFGKGNIMLKLEQLKQKLAAGGLFDQEHKKPIPKMPNNIAIITSVKGAAIQDILSTIYKRNQSQKITVIDVRVQGDFAARDIIKALKNVDLLNFDVIILARGGGSIEDLYPFNDEELIRTIFSLNTPIISAVGHETDFMLCDYVADHRAITPTAAAELVAYDIAEERQSVLHLIARIRQEVDTLFKDEHKTLDSVKLNLRLLLKNFYTREMLYIDSCKASIKALTESRLRNEETVIRHFLDLLDKLSPLNTLKKGYFKAERSGQGITGIGQLNIGEKIELFAADGSAEAVITNINRKEG